MTEGPTSSGDHPPGSSLEDLVGLEGKVALVTGAAAGIARETALRLAAAGCDVAVVDIDAEGAEACAQEIRALGRRAVAIHGDLTDHATPHRMVAEAIEALGPIQVAVNVPGGTAGVNKSFLDVSAEELQRVLEFNLVATFLSCQAEAIAMVKHGVQGVIVNVASTSGMTASPNLSPYGASKAAVVHFTKTAAVELAPYGIRVNCLVPGTHWTKITKKLGQGPESTPQHREFFAKAAQATPLGRLGEPGETAGVALFLASDLSSYMTGHSVVSDGGVLHTTARPALGGTKVPDALRDYIDQDSAKEQS